jgi:hypothetical protein
MKKNRPGMAEALLPLMVVVVLVVVMMMIEDSKLYYNYTYKWS